MFARCFVSSGHIPEHQIQEEKEDEQERKEGISPDGTRQ